MSVSIRNGVFSLETRNTLYQMKTDEAGMLNHPYSFDSIAQMEEQTSRSDGFFTNRSDLTIQYLIDKGLRTGTTTVPDPIATLQRLGY